MVGRIGPTIVPSLFSGVSTACDISPLCSVQPVYGAQNFCQLLSTLAKTCQFLIEMEEGLAGLSQQLYLHYLVDCPPPVISAHLCTVQPAYGAQNFCQLLQKLVNSRLKGGDLAHENLVNIQCM